MNLVARRRGRRGAGRVAVHAVRRCAKGRRPSFIDAARPEVALPLYEQFVALLRERGVTVETGEFGAMMDVELVNDGPVTLWLER